MRNKAIYFFILIFFFFSAFSLLGKPKKEYKVKKQSALTPLSIETADTAIFKIDGKTYNMRAVLNHLLLNNEQINQLLYDAAQADTNYEKFQKKYAVFLKLDGTYKKSNYPDDSVTGFSGTDLKRHTYSAALAKGFSSGTTLSLGFQRTYNHSVNMGPDYGDVEYFQPAFFLSVQQELLKNVLGYQERRQETIFKNHSAIINETIIYQTSMLTIDAVINAWQLALFNSAYSNAKLKLKETQKVRRIIRSNIQIGLNERYDLNYWNAQEAAHSIQVSNSLNQLQQQNRLVKLKFNVKKLPVENSGIAILSNKLPDINLQNALDRAYKKRADYTSARLALANAKLNLEISENNALPSMKAGLRVSSVGQRDKFNDALNDSLKNENPAYEVTVGLTYPLFDRAQKTEERNAVMNLRKAHLELTRKKKQVKNDVINGIDNINSAYQGYQKARKARIQSEIYYIRFSRQLRKGHFSAALIKQALDGMINSRQQELSALVYYNAMLLQFDITLNQLFSKHNINIKSLIEKRKIQ